MTPDDSSMKELCGKEAFDATGFRSGGMPQHSSPDAHFISGIVERPRKPRSALLSPPTQTLIRSPAESRPVEIGPSASSMSLRGAGANVYTRARLPRSTFPKLVPLPCTAILAGLRNLSRITAFGPIVALSTAAAQASGLALHELSTNAGKGEASSTDMGRVDIDRAITDDTFTMNWAERNRPTARPPDRKGFGGMGHRFNGEADRRR